MNSDTHHVLDPDALGWVYRQLLEYYGSQSWWPADTAFEVMLGAILTQNTAWSNVEKALENLKANVQLTLDDILELPESELAELIRPSGYYNIKAKRVRSICEAINTNGGEASLQSLDTSSLREFFLAIKGVGPETADDILLYAFHRPVFVIDAYTRRLMSRLGMLEGREGYEVIRRGIEAALDSDVSLFKEYHALIVQHAKAHCAVKARCGGCPLVPRCTDGKENLSDDDAVTA